jgi:hypothetical protein
MCRRLVPPARVAPPEPRVSLQRVARLASAAALVALAADESGSVLTHQPVEGRLVKRQHR